MNNSSANFEEQTDKKWAVEKQWLALSYFFAKSICFVKEQKSSYRECVAPMNHVRAFSVFGLIENKKKKKEIPIVLKGGNKTKEKKRFSF